MPKKKTKARCKDGASCGNPGGLPDSSKTVILNNCDHVQIGDGNTLLNLVHPERGQRTQTKLSRDQDGLLVLRNILTSDWMAYEDVQTSVKAMLSKLNQTFFKYAGTPLAEFLILHNDEFIIKRRRGRKCVRRKRKQLIEKSEKASLAIAHEKEHDEDVLSSSDSDESFISSTSQTPFTETDVEKNDYEDWVRVESKKQRKQKVLAEAGQTRISPRNDYQHPMYERLIHIMSNTNDTNTLFIPTHDLYKVNPLRCCLHIVAMWNTPYRQVSYIVIGIEKDPTARLILKGTEDSFDDVTFYDTLFECNENKSFDGVPSYVYHRLFCDSKLFGMIEIQSSFGKCNPIFVTRACSSEDIHLEANQLWCIKKDGPDICRPQEYSPIFMWFHGRSPASKSAESIDSNNTDFVTSSSQTAPSKDEECTSNTGVASFGKSFPELWEKTKGFKTGSYVLISGDLPQNIRNMKQLARIHWKAVYDFDIMSTMTGTLNAMQDQIESTHHLRIGTWQEGVPEIREESTWWCFMRGRKEIHESRTDLDTKINAIETPHKWFRTVKQSITDNGEALAVFSEDNTPLTFLILWPFREDIAPLMIKFLERIIDRLSYQPQIIVCLHENLTDKGRIRLNALSEEFRENLFVSHVDFATMCQGLANHIAKSMETSQDYSLPKEEGYEPEPINKKDAIWLSEDIDVLYTHNVYPNQESDEIEKELTNFYKGGSLHWPMWYLKGGGNVEIDRDLLNSLEEKINAHLNKYRTTVITLYHNPGAGGSTLAKRVLWNFHKKVPCVHAKTMSKTHSKDLSRKIVFIYQKTHLPVLVLIDGEDETMVKYLRTVLKYSVILYVKRYPYSITNESACDDVYLKGLVSQTESQKLAEKFGERCDDGKRTALRKLSTEVSQGNAHNLYEFGMTAFCHEFKGTATYVEGYLQLRENPTEDLLPWQLCLGYLSLVYYYGQNSVPCQFFARLFGKPAQYAMSFEDDFPHPITEFVVKDKDEMGKNYIRICHFLIAKEILEQLLTRKRNTEDKSCSDRLSLPARRNLANFCKQFIEYASSKKSKHLSNMARNLLTRTFIFRDAKDMGENEEQRRRRPVLSKVIIDIPADNIYTERLKVLEKLSDSFPTDPNFLAHVGRFYAFCRPNEEEQAERYFNKALDMCDSLNKGKTEDQLSDSMKSSMMHIYHMYGIVKHRTVKRLLARHQERPDGNLSLIEHKTMKELIDTAEIACDYFKKSRDITPETKEAYTYAYTGEIEVRIQICDFIKMRFMSKSQQSFNQICSSDLDLHVKRFVLTSIHVIEVLLLECYKDIDLSADDVSSLSRLVKWYREVFRNEKFSSLNLILDSVCQKRIKIIEKKNQFGSRNTISGLEHVHDPDTMNEIVCLYEEIFSEVSRKGLLGGKKSLKELDHDYREWILAIRQVSLEKKYSLEEVLKHVQNWYDLVKSPMATFYCFVVNSLLGFGIAKKTPRTECLIAARDLQEEMTKMTRLLLRPNYPREWLGNSDKGISVLIPGNKYVGLGMGADDKETHRSDLAVCKGTLRHPNKNPVGGFIAYDIASVDVFYLPKRANLTGQRYAGRRVEFCLAFSVERGYEAFNVKLLKRFGCPQCGRAVEFRSVDLQVICICGETVYKDDFTDVGEVSN